MLLKIEQFQGRRHKCSNDKNLKNKKTFDNVLLYLELLCEKDTVQVAVFDPHEVDSSMGHDWTDKTILFLLH